MYQKDKSFASKVKLGQASNRYKGVFEAAKLGYANKNNNSSIDVKIDWSVLEEKSSFKMLGLTFLNWITVLTLPLLLKLPPRKLEL